MQELHFLKEFGWGHLLPVTGLPTARLLVSGMFRTVHLVQAILTGIKLNFSQFVS